MVASSVQDTHQAAVGAAEGLCIVALENPTPVRTPGLLWKRDPAVRFGRASCDRAVTSLELPSKSIWL